MSAITISRQMGSRGRQIAFIVAETLGFTLVWRELINEAARRTGTPEVALAAIDELGLLGICPIPESLPCLSSSRKRNHARISRKRKYCNSWACWTDHPWRSNRYFTCQIDSAHRYTDHTNCTTDRDNRRMRQGAN